uniref:DNA helicase n=1 Tax=Lactuca sativa TaxID=4236 RepID=A0A9R1WI84_LACSA|nr:hypothetical protein LSAT_V11C200070580 [Lactuca sativa]
MIFLSSYHLIFSNMLSILMQLSAEARNFLVDSYVALPRGDTTPRSRVAYSMTVRQLEALIRLLEAISRCHLDDEVHPRHVKLATRLLKTSVIRHVLFINFCRIVIACKHIVESTEIDLTEFQEENQEEGDVEPQIADVDADSNNDQPGFSCKIDGAEFKTEDKKLVKDQNLHKNLISDERTKRSQLKLQMAFDGQERDMKRSWEPSDKADLHFVYKDVEGASTQWDDIQRKLRNLPPKPSAFKPDPFTPVEDEDSKPKTKSRIDNKTEELKDLEDDLNDSCFLEEYRKRLAEMKETVED